MLLHSTSYLLHSTAYQLLCQCFTDLVCNAAEDDCTWTPGPRDLEQSCNSLPCESFTLKVGAWTQCSESCGGGFQMAQHLCISSYGFAAPVENCENVPPSFQECNVDACDTPYYTYAPWSTCSVECGGGEKTREATCNTASGEATDDSECSDAGIERFRTSATCNSKPCEAFGWNVSAWSECDAACGGQRMREVTCVYVSSSFRHLRQDRHVEIWQHSPSRALPS